MKLHRILVIVYGAFLLLHHGEEGAIKVKSVDASTQKWADKARGAATEFAAEAEAAASDWATKTQAARDNYGQAISAAGIKDRFARGVAKAGAAKYARKIKDVGSNRFSAGVEAAQVDYKEGATPFFQTIAALNLPGRKPRGDPGNISRVEAVTKALNAKRLALLGSSGG